MVSDGELQATEVGSVFGERAKVGLDGLLSIGGAGQK